jgi:hypothetical protein
MLADVIARPRYEPALTPWALVPRPESSQPTAILDRDGEIALVSETLAAVLVHIDLDADRPHGSSLVALVAGRQIAAGWGATLYAAAIVHDANAASGAVPTPRKYERLQHELARAGADKVILGVSETPVAPLWGAVGGVWQAVLERLRPRLVLFGADAPSSAELAPRTAARSSARLFLRARVVGSGEVELRDRDGAYARADDAGAVVASVGAATGRATASTDVDVMMIPASGADARLELASTGVVELAHGRAIVALGDDVLADTRIVAGARRLATHLGARLVAGPQAAKAGVISAAEVVDHTTPLAPEVCILIGAAKLELAGCTRVVQLGNDADQLADGVLAAPLAPVLEDLLTRLGSA